MISHASDSGTILGKLIAAIVIVAVLFVGMDFHHAAAAVSHGPDSAVALTQDHGSVPASEQGIAGDHHCHGCVTLVAIDGMARQIRTGNTAPPAASVPVLSGMMAAPPGRPPRATIPTV